MKCVILLVAVLRFQAYATQSNTRDQISDEIPDQIPVFIRYDQECMNETGVDKDFVSEVIDVPPVSEDELLPENDKFKQYVVCMAKKLHFIDAAGLIQKKMIMQFLRTEFSQIPDDVDLKKIDDRCAVQKDTPLKTATHMYNCIRAEVYFDENEKFSYFSRKCRNETGVDRESEEKLYLPSSRNEILAEDAKLQKYVVCLGTKMRLINAEGLVQKDTLKEILRRSFKDEVKGNEIADKCAVQKDTLWRTAIHIIKCIKTETADLD